MFTTLKPLVLASESPRRIGMLREMGLRFKTIAPRIEEEVLAKEDPQEHTKRLAIAKAIEVARGKPAAYVLGADTVVVLRGQIIGKPSGEEEAVEILSMIGGKEHEVVTSFAILKGTQGAPLAISTVRTAVRIRNISRKQVKAYVKTGEPLDKAGAYAIQGIGAWMVERVEGSYSNVVGLPLTEVVEALLRLKIIRVSGSK